MIVQYIHHCIGILAETVGSMVHFVYGEGLYNTTQRKVQKDSSVHIQLSFKSLGLVWLFHCFWNKSLLINKASFIWLQTQNSNIVKSYYSLKYLFEYI